MSMHYDIKGDAVLDSYINAVNESKEMGIGITLFVGGAVVTGTLIGVREYFELLARFWSDVVETAEGAEMAKAHRDLGERSRDALMKNAEDDVQRPLFVHLKNAQVISPQAAFPTKPAMLWRGRVGEVQAYSMGTMQLQVRG